MPNRKHLRFRRNDGSLECRRNGVLYVTREAGPCPDNRTYYTIALDTNEGDVLAADWFATERQAARWLNRAMRKIEDDNQPGPDAV